MASRKGRLPCGVGILLCVVALAAEPATAAESLLFPKGTRARLEYTIGIDGSAERHEDIGAFDKWRTHRTLKASIEVVADSPGRASPIDAVAAAQAAARPPSADMRALEQEARACAGDLACMTTVAQKMSEMSEVRDAIAQSEATDRLPLRYQGWAARRDARREVEATIETRTDKLFLTSVKERTICTQSAQLGADKLFVDATVVVDAQQGIGYLGNALAAGLPVIVERHCELDMGGRKSARVDQQAEPFLPNVPDPARFFPGDAAADGSVISRGHLEIQGSYGDILGVPKAARVVVDWKLTKI